MLVVLIVVAVLYFARTVFIPLALAVLLAFLLAPISTRLRRWGLGRIPSALAVVLIFFAIIGVIGTALTAQLKGFAQELPGYQSNIQKKFEVLRTSGRGAIGRVSNLLSNVSEDLTPHPTNTNTEEKPVPVEIRKANFSPLTVVQKVLGSVVEGVLAAVIVLVFVIFMLSEREDLRDRIIRLGGAKRVNATTTLLDEAAYRVSRYLVAQLAVNITYGAVVGIGLYAIGVPDPLLWAIVAALFRYIPYLGIWIAGTLSALVAFAVEPGWIKVPMVIGIYGGSDLILYNFVEPLLYGSSTGLSPLSILIAAVFWTWLWGPIGLLLSTPLTVCVVVLGRHVPRLWFLKILLSDEPVLAPATRFYQRMLAMDLDEATEIAEDLLQDKSLAELYDTVLIPALSLAEEDRHQGRLDERRQQFIIQGTKILIEDLAERKAVAEDGENAGPSTEAERPERLQVVCVPARDDADEIATAMLQQLLQKRNITAEVVPAASLTGESIERVTKEAPEVACVLAVPPFGYVHARYLSRRLRAEFPHLKLVGAILTERDVDEIKQRQPPLGTDEIVSTIGEAVGKILTLVHVRGSTRPQAAPVVS